MNPFATPTEILILLLLSEHGPKGLYGLEIVRVSAGKLARGSVYTLLGRLTLKGFVEATDDYDPEHGGMPRPRYRLTSQGRRLLDAVSLMGFEPAKG